MELRRRWIAELRSREGGDLRRLSPSQLAAAVAVVLETDAAGLVMMHRLLRLPVGASDEEATRAEQLQASLGEGPCLTSATSGRPLSAGLPDLVSRWPVYGRGLVAGTSFRSTSSFPLRTADGHVFAALDLYHSSTSPPEAARRPEITTEIGDLLSMLLVLAAPDERVPWQGATHASTRSRHRVWVGIGMVVEATGLRDLDALAHLRSYAFVHDLLLDEVAELMLDGALTPEQVLADRP